MTLDQLHDLMIWHERHWREQPLEKDAWDMVLTLWLVGWVGIPVALLVHVGWALALCAVLLFLPGLYVSVRRRLHRRQALRCDWIVAIRQPER